jgi:hypothetical protein
MYRVSDKGLPSGADYTGFEVPSALVESGFESAPRPSATLELA